MKLGWPTLYDYHVPGLAAVCQEQPTTVLLSFPQVCLRLVSLGFACG